MSEIVEFEGFIDVHAHFRDPGMPEAETSASGLAAATRGGFAAVVVMPNTTPPGDSCAWVRKNLHITSPDSVRVFPSACITMGRRGEKLSYMFNLVEDGAVFFTDDGNYVEDDDVMEDAMWCARGRGVAICDHAMSWKNHPHGVIRDCALARKLNLPIIVPEVETDAIRRDLSLCRVTGCRLHIQHISTAQGVELIREAQKEGLPVSAEATPHHLLLTCDDLTVDDANFKMAPPLGTREDRAELRKAVKDGVLMFATDHAPHPSAAKSQGFEKSANGIIGLETAVAITYQVMVEEEGMPLADWARAWTEMPRTLFSSDYKLVLSNLPRTRLEIGAPHKWDLPKSVSLSRNCPYDGFTSSCWPVAYTQTLGENGNE